MRIRRNAKIFARSSCSNSSTVCKLNQSPWDVIPFHLLPPPPPDSCFLHQASVGDESVTADASSGGSAGANGSAASMIISVNGGEEEKPTLLYSSTVSAEGGEAAGVGMLGGKGGGEGGWLSRKESKEVRDNLARLRSRDDSTGYHSGEAAQSLPRHPRDQGRKPPPDPSGYYYYSGFGPLWGKRRGSASRGEPSNASSTAPSSSTGDNHDNELDFHDIDEDDGVGGQGVGRKRRKPVKARSLKSLM